jgi:hypothetical protein
MMMDKTKTRPCRNNGQLNSILFVLLSLCCQCLSFSLAYGLVSVSSLSVSLSSLSSSPPSPLSSQHVSVFQRNKVTSSSGRYSMRLFLQQQEQQPSDNNYNNNNNSGIIKDISFGNTNNRNSNRNCDNEPTINAPVESFAVVDNIDVTDHDQKEHEVVTTATTTTITTTTTTPTMMTPQFGDVVPMKRPSSSPPTKNNDNINNNVKDKYSTSSSPYLSDSSSHTTQLDEINDNNKDTSFIINNGFRDSIPVATTTTSTTTSTTNTIPKGQTQPQSQVQLYQRKQRNIAVAIASISMAVLNYAWQWTHPVTPIQLLVSMQQSSSSLETIGTNHKPTVIDFWAPWYVLCVWVCVWVWVCVCTVRNGNT